jgi:hypothetical protein
MMSREEDVKAYGTIVRELRAPGELGRDSLFEVEIADQDGEHLSGARHHVSARVVQARRSFKMAARGVQLDDGDVVALLVNPRPNRHVCAMITRVGSGRR